MGKSDTNIGDSSTCLGGTRVHQSPTVVDRLFVYVLRSSSAMIGCLAGTCDEQSSSESKSKVSLAERMGKFRTS